MVNYLGELFLVNCSRSQCLPWFWSCSCLRVARRACSCDFAMALLTGGFIHRHTNSFKFRQKLMQIFGHFILDFRVQLLINFPFKSKVESPSICVNPCTRILVVIVPVRIHEGRKQRLVPRCLLTFLHSIIICRMKKTMKHLLLSLFYIKF